MGRLRQTLAACAALALPACAVVERQGAEGTERRLVLGAPAMVLRVAPGAAVETVSVQGLGVFTGPQGTGIGLHSERLAYFPGRCGAVFVDASPQAIDRIAAAAPDISKDCIQPRKETPP